MAKSTICGLAKLATVKNPPNCCLLGTNPRFNTEARVSSAVSKLSFLLDPPALLLIGFLVGKLYYLMVVFGDRIISRGASRKGLFAFGAAVVALFWVYSTLLYLNVIYFPWPLPHWYGGTNWMLNSGLPLGLTRNPTTDIVAVVIFASYPFWFYLGAELAKAGHRLTTAQREAERNRIIAELANAEFPQGGVIPPGAQDVGTAASVEALLGRIPSLYEDAITLLLFVYDSRFFVLFFTGRWKRFVDLDSKEKSRYMRVWDSNAFLVTVGQIIRITMSYGFYTKAQVYGFFDYGGPMEPNLPPWYNPGPPEGSGSEAGR
jgi:hypothetical protein